MTFKHEARRPSTVWILVADRARARLFSAEWPGLEEFREVQGFTHPEGAARPQDVESDGPGRFSESGGPQHAGDRVTDFKHQTATEFARELIAALQTGRSGNAFGRLIVVAPALFLGVLREQLPGPLKTMLVADLDKDLTRAAVREIQSEVGELAAAVNQN